VAGSYLCHFVEADESREIVSTVTALLGMAETANGSGNDRPCGGFGGCILGRQPGNFDTFDRHSSLPIPGMRHSS